MELNLLDEDCRTAGYYWGKTIAGVHLQWNLQVCMGDLDSHHSHQWSSLKNSLVLPQAIVIREHPYEYPVRCALACRVIIHRQWFPWPLTPDLLCINWNIVITHARIHDWYGQESILLNSLHWCQQKHLKCNHPIEITPMTIITNCSSSYSAQQHLAYGKVDSLTLGSIIMPPTPLQDMSLPGPHIHHCCARTLSLNMLHCYTL